MNQLTTAFTALLSSGDITALIGTRSLLGEGWDAPCVNSLILASVVGSFMLTNQMRGRAIRIDKSIANKISSIWHLVAIDMQSISGLRDYYELEKRFKTFVGLSESDNVIESGFKRLDVEPFKNLRIGQNESLFADSIHSKMRGRYKKRQRLLERWQEALTIEANARVLPSVTAPTIPKLNTYHFKNALKVLMLELGAAIASALSYIYYFRASDFQMLLLFGCVLFARVLLYRLLQAIAVTRIALKHLPVDGSLKQIGVALAEALCCAGFVETSFWKIKVKTVKLHDGSVVLSLAGSTFYESSLFADCISEILGPIDNPRYMVVREGAIFGLNRDDYHAVPLKFGVKKELADIFYKAWCKYVCSTELIYIRSQQGKQQLLKAKMRAFSSTFENKVKREDRWQGID